MEESDYSLIASRDVNNYVAIKTNGVVKGKGDFANPWVDTSPSPDKLSKNPDAGIVAEAIYEYLKNKTPIESTIEGCRDIRKFICVREVSGGAMALSWGTKESEDIGKIARWYYAKNCDIVLVCANKYTTNGEHQNVADAAGVRPVSILPKDFPEDVDFGYYIKKAKEALEKLGCAPEQVLDKNADVIFEPIYDKKAYSGNLRLAERLESNPQGQLAWNF